MSADFSRALELFAVKAKFATHEVFVRSAQLAHESIKVGSQISGAPGQPLDTGALRNSWILDVGATEATITTNIAYAPVIENGVRAAYDARGVQPVRKRQAEGGTPRRKSTVGGPHSVKLTINGFGRIVAHAAREFLRG